MTAVRASLQEPDEVSEDEAEEVVERLPEEITEHVVIVAAPPVVVEDAERLVAEAAEQLAVAQSTAETAAPPLVIEDIVEPPVVAMEDDAPRPVVMVAAVVQRVEEVVEMGPHLPLDLAPHQRIYKTRTITRLFTPAGQIYAVQEDFSY